MPNLFAEHRNLFYGKTSGITSGRPDRARTKISTADAALARIIDAWPMLAEPLRKAMLALAESAGGRRNR